MSMGTQDRNLYPTAPSFLGCITYLVSFIFYFFQVE